MSGRLIKRAFFMVFSNFLSALRLSLVPMAAVLIIARRFEAGPRLLINFLPIGVWVLVTWLWALFFLMLLVAAIGVPMKLKQAWAETRKAQWMIFWALLLHGHGFKNTVENS
ncbi:MAG: hypothetical protein JKX69_14230 [Rhodobacteraceae bacterium]|nr:hypothetical protein [Paracoccaceae bacterium]